MSTGKLTYSTMLAKHNETFPEYVAELQGLAQGAGVAFELIFMQNIRESMDTVASDDSPQPLRVSLTREHWWSAPTPLEGESAHPISYI